MEKNFEVEGATKKNEAEALQHNPIPQKSSRRFEDEKRSVHKVHEHRRQETTMKFEAEGGYTIIGAGFSGLIAGYILKSKGCNIKIFEASDRVGGKLQTTKTEFGISESAAHSFLSSDNLLELCESLGVELLKVKTKNRFIYRDGKMRKIPLRFIEILEVVKNLLFKKGKNHYNSLKDLSDHHFSTKFSDYFLSSVINGIYGCKLSMIDPYFAFPSLVPTKNSSMFRHLLKHKRGKKSVMVAPKFGMQDLVDKLYENLRDDIVLNCKIDSLDILHNSFPQSEYWNQEVIKEGEEKVRHSSSSQNNPRQSDGEKRNVHKVHEHRRQETTTKFVAEVGYGMIIATDAWSAGKILGIQELCDIEYNSLSTATIFVENCEKFPDGIGVLNVKTNDVKSMGILFNSKSFDERVVSEKYQSFTMFFNDINVDEEDIKHDLEKILGIKANIVNIKIWKWQNALPIYSKKTRQVIDSLKLPDNIVLLGNYLGDISLRKICDQIVELVKNDL